MWWAALPLAVLPEAALAAQVAPETQPTAALPADQQATVDFSADQVTYDSDDDVLTASGQVRMSREGNYLAADSVTWNRKTGQVTAIGNVVVVDPQGDKVVGESVNLTDTLR